MSDKQAKAAQSAKLLAIAVIPPIGPRPCCGKCNNPVDSDVTTPNEFLNHEKNSPWFCSKCERWYHYACRRPGGGFVYCPDCGKKMFRAGRFHCLTCARLVAVKVNSTWPNFACIKCGTSTSIVALVEMFDIAALEIVVLSFIGFLSLFPFISTGDGRTHPVWKQFDLSNPTTIITGVIAILLAVPWIVMWMAFFSGQAGLYPHDALSVSQVREFSNRPRWRRLIDVYLWALVKGLAIIIPLLAGWAAVDLFRSHFQH